MRVRIEPCDAVSGALRVPGDKSIAHRWMMLAATAQGPSILRELPPSLDVCSTAACLAALFPKARPALDAWVRETASGAEGNGSTWNRRSAVTASPTLEVEGEGRGASREPLGALDCGNSGTTMRLLAGVVAAAPFRTLLHGDPSLSRRPMERVAEPLRRMGAAVETDDGHAPLAVRGGTLRGIHHRLPLPSAQVKSAVLLAGLAAHGRTTVEEPIATRDHTERALRALRAPIRVEENAISVERFQHRGLEGTVPGDISSAAFGIAAAALMGSTLEVERVGLNPTRTRFLEVMGRMGVRAESRLEGSVMEEPVGSVRVLSSNGLIGTRIDQDELPLVIDEVPMLAMLAAHAHGETWLLGARELRLKESDRLRAIADGIRDLGGHAGDEGDDLVIAGGGLRGGRAQACGDHRLAMALAVGALAAEAPSEIDGMEAADVSFPGFVDALRALGARIRVTD